MDVVRGRCEEPSRELGAGGRVVSAWAIEANRNYPTVHFTLAAALGAPLVDWSRRIPPSWPGSRPATPAFSISRARAGRTARSDDPTYLAQLERILEGLRLAGVPEQ